MYFPEFPIPFFVVDRPISLDILKYCEIHKQSEYFGLMGHANTSDNFQNLFRKFPSSNIFKMVDSGVFTKDGCKLKYKDLFSTYEKMGADYGIMIDILKDKDKTLKSAQKAIKIYHKGNYRFNLVGVAQGNDLEEYVECYKELKSLGFNHIAIGGLLKKSLNSARYVKVKNENFLVEVLREIRNFDQRGWLFTLGCYHPKRHSLLKKFGVFGADYKGWILNYKTPKQILENINKRLKFLETEYKVNDQKLDKLLNKLIIFQEKRNLEKNKDLKRKIDAKIEFLNDQILIIRKELSNSLKKEEYSFNITNFEKFLNMDKKTKQEHRFNQVKSYIYKNIFSLYKDNLLIISCSQKKVFTVNPKPAIKLYDGPYYRMIRKLGHKNLLNTHIIIISAKYGLLSPFDPIDYYDKKMTKERALKLNCIIKTELIKFLSNKKFKEVFISMGKTYLFCLEGINFEIPVYVAKGKIGQKLSKTKKWLVNSE